MIFKGDLVQFLVHTMKMSGQFSSLIALMLALLSATGSPIPSKLSLPTLVISTLYSSPVLITDYHKTLSPDCTTSSARSVQSAEVICEDVYEAHDPEDGQQAIIEDEDLVNRVMSKGDQTDSSNDYEIMITPRLWKKLLAARKKRRGFWKRRGRNSRRGKREDGDDDDEIMITPRLWKKLQAAQKKRGKGGKD